MKIFARDLILGEFRSSEFGMNALVSFDGNADDEEETVFAIETQEEYIGDNPYAVYEGQKYSGGFEFTITIAKDDCNFRDKTAMNEYEVRSVLRLTTGYHGYMWMKILPDTDLPTEDEWYKVRITNVAFRRINGHVLGIILSAKTDSYFAYTPEKYINVDLPANGSVSFFTETDDLTNYILPNVTIKPASSGTLRITNESDITTQYPAGWVTELTDVTANQAITMNSKSGILSHSLNKFNMHWIRLVPKKNIIKTNIAVNLSIRYRSAIKGGFIVR